MKSINNLKYISNYLEGTYIATALKVFFLRKHSSTIIIAVGFSIWKEPFIRAFFKNKIVFFANDKKKINFIRRLLSNHSIIFVIWSFKDESLSLDAKLFRGFQVYRIEDGFIRSIGKGADHHHPWSLCFDKTGMYFDGSKSSDFENLCNMFHEHDHPKAMKEADANQRMILDLSINKYNIRSTVQDINLPQYCKGAVLVLGQIEDDQSIIRNQNAISTNWKLIKRAIKDNPGKKIYFKQHPDCLGCSPRSGFVDIHANDRVVEIDHAISITDAIVAVDTVYTISSLGGFEALMHGKKVVTFGCPFYAGWGLTKDYVVFKRRKRTLTVRQLFCISYILYPTYFNPYDGTRLSLNDVLICFSAQLKKENKRL